AVPAAAALALFLFVPDAATNAWARLLAPWKATPRYTFAAVEPLPARLVVPHGEPFTVAVRLNGKTAWRPARGAARLRGPEPVAAGRVPGVLRGGGYGCAVPRQIARAGLPARVGDARQRVRVEPTLRPELTSVVADVALPDYLGRPQPEKKDVRGGAVSLVKG